MEVRAIVVAVFLLLCMASVVDGWRRWHYTTPRPSTLSSRWRALEQKVQHLRNRGYWMQRSSKYITREQSWMMQELTGSVANMSQALSEEMRLMKEIGRENAHEYEEITDELRRQQRRVQSQIQGLWSAVERLGGGTPEPPFQRTTDAPTRTCRWNEFKCTHRNRCVPRSYLCDRDNDCGDWSDEQPHNCPDRTTPQPWRPETTPSGRGPNGLIRFPNANRGTAEVGGGIVSYISGHVQIRHQGSWGSICDDSFDDGDAAVICRTGGYYGGQYSGGRYKQILRYNRPTRIWLDDLACRGWERHINDCPRVHWGRHNCGHSEDVGIMCYVNAPRPTGRPHPEPETTPSGRTVDVTPYISVTQGACSSITYSQCRDKARQLRIRFSAFGVPSYPPGCYHKPSDGHIYFNAQPSSRMPCTRVRQCICQPGSARGGSTVWSTRSPWRPRTTDTPTRTCRWNEFKCTHRNKCVPRSYLCDHHNDCGDWSDELPNICPYQTTAQPWGPQSTENPWEPRPTDSPRTCRSDQFKCTHRNRCVPRSYLCDRDNDCGDWSDEQPNNCPDRTTPQPWRPQSTENPWEPRSTATPCPPHKYSCDNGRTCIPSIYLCDAYADCRDGSDELYENCRRLNATIHPPYTGGPQPTHGPWKPHYTAEPQTNYYWKDEPSDVVKKIEKPVKDLVTKKK